MNEKAHIFCGRKTWLEGPAVEQFKRVMTFPGILQGAAFPDLHPGRGVPVGAAFLSRGLIYPALIGNDIGCGMTLFSLGCAEHKFKKDKLFRSMRPNSFHRASSSLYRKQRLNILEARIHVCTPTRCL